MSAIVMLMFLSLLIIAFAAKLILWTPKLWRHQPVGVVAIGLGEALLTGFYVVRITTIWSVLFALFELYQLFNLYRLYKGRMQVDHMRRVTHRTAVVLLILQLLVLIAADIVGRTVTLSAALLCLGVLQLLFSLLVYSSTQRHLRTTKTLQATSHYTDHELPSVSVLIPARNETDDLFACLEALVASNYPKLEIIVLDDNSQDRRTPEIIRGFAHDGVRFIAGKQPDANWLAKNYAYQQLAEASSGDYLLFCGVDVRLSPNAIREFITTLLEKKKSMLSILPYNARPTDKRVLLVQPFRYAWELSLPRRLFRRPAVLSTCWVIKREALLAAGSLKAVSRSILPESHLARVTTRNDGYSFLRSNLLVSSKPFMEQQATAIRMRYPQMHRRPEQVALVALIELVGAVLPVATLLAALFADVPVAVGFSALAFVLLCTTYFQVTGIMYGRPVLLGLCLVPVAALYDICLLHVSMWRYEFGEVRWKERNISGPVMRFVSSVPVRQSKQPAVTQEQHSV